MRIELDSMEQTSEFTRSWLGHAVLNCAGDAAFEHIVPDGERFIDIEMTVNGKSVNPKEFFDNLGKDYDSYVEAAAKDLVQEKAWELSNAMMEIAEKIKYLDMKVADKVGY